MSDETAKALIDALNRFCETIDGMEGQYGVISRLEDTNRKLIALYEEGVFHHLIEHTKALNKFSESR